MGLEGIGIWQLLIILAICVMIFGTKKLRNMGSDVGSAVKSFRSAMRDEDKPEEKVDDTATVTPASIAADQQKHKQ